MLNSIEGPPQPNGLSVTQWLHHFANKPLDATDEFKQAKQSHKDQSKFRPDIIDPRSLTFNEHQLPSAQGGTYQTLIQAEFGARHGQLPPSALPELERSLSSALVAQRQLGVEYKLPREIKDLVDASHISLAELARLSIQYYRGNMTLKNTISYSGPNYAPEQPNTTRTLQVAAIREGNNDEEKIYPYLAVNEVGSLTTTMLRIFQQPGGNEILMLTAPLKDKALIEIAESMGVDISTNTLCHMIISNLGSNVEGPVLSVQFRSEIPNI